MMRLWTESRTRSSAAALPVAAMSVGVHAAVIGLWIAATLPPQSVGEDSIANRVYYIPPPDRPGGAGGRGENVHYVEVSGAGSGLGSTARPADASPGFALDRTAKAKTDTAQQMADTAVREPPQPRGDSIYTVLQVDTEVTRSAHSAAPAYPIDLMQRGIEGAVRARYVVDTTGFADTSSIVILSSTNAGFTDAVRAALPYMRFHPARIGALRVRQLVEQWFTFRIQRPSGPAKPPD